MATSDNRFAGAIRPPAAPAPRADSIAALWAELLAALAARPEGLEAPFDWDAVLQAWVAARGLSGRDPAGTAAAQIRVAALADGWRIRVRRGAAHLARAAAEAPAPAPAPAAAGQRR